MSTPIQVPVGKAKMWASAIGGTLTAALSVVATINTAFEDNGLDFGELGLIASAVVAFVGTVRAVWAVTNKPLTSGNVR